MLKIDLQTHDGEQLFCPVLSCDWCGKRINVIRETLVVWNPQEAGKPTQATAGLVHKGHCYRNYAEVYMSEAYPKDYTVTGALALAQLVTAYTRDNDLGRQVAEAIGNWTDRNE